MRLLFAGTPQVALPSLEALLASRHEVVAVLTRPDAPAGRGRHLLASPVAARARDLGLEVLTPARPADPDFLARLRALAPDAAPVVAYGGLIPPQALAVPAHGWINLHFSLLPAWRGAAPVQHAILAGDDVTGASTFLIEEGLDTGPVLGTMTETIRPDDTSGALLARLAQAGAPLLVASLDAVEAGSADPRPQPADGVSRAPKLRADDAEIRWHDPAPAVDRRIRAATPDPGAWTTFRDARLRVAPLALPPAGPATDPGDGPVLAPGAVHATRREVFVGTATGPVRLTEVTPQGKRPMSAADWARGVRPEPGERFGGSPR